MFNSHQKEQGFTLIEIIVSLAIFSIVITIAVGALLVLLSSNQKLQNDQGVMTNLSFALDSMTRELRTGYNYYCDSFENINAGGAATNFLRDDKKQEATGGPGNDGEGLEINSVKDCPTGRPANDKVQGVSFVEGGDSITGSANNRIAYFFQKPTDDSDGEVGTIKRRVGNGTAQSIISSDIEIMDANFVVTGSIPLSDASNNAEQPTITIYIEAKKVGEDKLYYLQTTVTQRTLDL